MLSLALRLSMNSSLLSGSSPIALYAVLGIRPELVLDFDDEKYFANSASTTFSDAITHSASSNATMVDSDGLLKWRPHNLLTYSEQFDNAAWTKTNATVTANAAVAPDGTNTADALFEATATGEHNVFQSLTGGPQQTVGVFVKAGLRQNFILRQNISSTWRNANFVLSGSGSVGTTTGFDSASITALPDGWYYCTATSTNRTDSKVLFLSSTGDEVISFSGDDSAAALYLWGAHHYRSDLGGMVNNPDRGDSYVPTTSSAVYLPRRGHHVYNGSAWVNEGLLHESEARVNIWLYSSDLSNAAIVKNNATITNDGDDLGGGSTGSRCTSSSTASSQVYDDLTVTAETTYTFSFYCKNINATDVSYFVFDLSNSANIVALTSFFSEINTNRFSRVSVTFTTPAGCTSIRLGVRNWDDTTDIVLDGLQLEPASTPSSYIPTSGSTVTRAAETLTVPSAKLPWPTPNVIGPELADWGGIDSDTGWNLQSNWSISGGELVGSGSSADRAFSPVTYSSAGVYRVEFDYSGASGNLSVELSGSPVLQQGYSGSGRASLVRVATSGGPITFRSGVFTGTIDNVSVREIDPLAVSIQMQGRMTYADTGATEVTFSRWYKDGDNFITSELSAASGRTGKPVFIQEALAIQDAVLASSDYAPGINVPFNIASRHGSTFINGAVDGTALTADTTPTALPDLSATDLSLGYDYMGTIKMLRIWADDLGDTGVALSSATAPVITGLPTIGVS